MRPARRSGSQRAFWAAVPYSAKVRIGPKLPNCTTSALRGHTAATCSMAMMASIRVPPWPPSACAMVMPIRPWALISLATSNGKPAWCARASASLREPRLREAAHLLGEQLLLVGELEIHAVLMLGISELATPSFGRPGHSASKTRVNALAEPGPIRRSRSRGHGVWVPAFAGTTSEMYQGASVTPPWRPTCARSPTTWSPRGRCRRRIRRGCWAAARCRRWPCAPWCRGH